MRRRDYTRQIEGTSALQMVEAGAFHSSCRMIGFSDVSAAHCMSEKPLELRVSRNDHATCKRPSKTEVAVAFVVGCIISFGSLFLVI